MLAKQVHIDSHRSMDLLTARVIYEADKGERSWLEQPWSSLRAVRLFFVQHTLDAIVILGLLCLVVLFLHALQLLG